jgi:hypothetical protein
MRLSWDEEKHHASFQVLVIKGAKSVDVKGRKFLIF